MPENFKSKNGATLSGHSEKWADKNRRAGSFQAGQGSRGSRNQGTGAAGKANTVATDTVDTTKMSPEEKLKYFNSLGLMQPKADKAKPAAQKAPEQPVQPKEPEAKAPVQNPVKELSDRLMKVFAQKPNLIQGIVKALQAVPKEEMKDTAQRVLNSMNGNSSNDPSEVFSTVMNAIENKAQPEEPTEAPRNRSGKMSEKEFRDVNAYLGSDFVDSIIKQVKQFKDFEEALFTVDMAIENVDDVNDKRAVRNSMASAADDLSTRFEMVDDSTEEDEEQSDQSEPEEGSIDWIRKINKFAFDQNSKEPFDSYASYRDLLKNKHDSRLFQDYMEMMERNPKTKPLYDLAMHKLNDFDVEEGEDSRFINIGDAVFSVLKDGEGVEQSSGTDTDSTGDDGSIVIDTDNLPPGYKHAYERDKEAYNAPDLETGLKILRASKGHGKELKELLQYFADGLKAEGVKPASINKTLSHYMGQLKDNYYKFLKAENAMIDNAEAYDPDEGYTEMEHNMLSFESALEAYDRGDITDHEKEFIDLYKKLRGE